MLETRVLVWIKSESIAGIQQGRRADNRAEKKVIKSYLPSIGGVYGKLWQSRNALAFPFPLSKAFLLSAPLNTTTTTLFFNQLLIALS